MELWSAVGDLVWLPVGEADAAAVIAEHEPLIDAIAAREPERARALAERHVAAETDRVLELRLALGEP